MNIRPLSHARIQITDPFWTPKLNKYATDSISESWAYLEPVVAEARALAAGQASPRKQSTFHEANLYKIVEAAVYALHHVPTIELRSKLDEMIKTIESTQRSDGYTYIYGRSRGLEPFENLLLLEEYCLGHLYEAAMARAEGANDSFVQACLRSALHAYGLFVEKRSIRLCPTSAQFEIGLVMLYRRTGDRRCLDLAKDLLERRGKGLNGWDGEKAEQSDTRHEY